MTRLLSRQDVVNTLQMKDTIEILAKAFTDLSEEKVIMPDRVSISIPDHDGLALYMPAYLKDFGTFGIKVVTVYRENFQRHNLPTIMGTIFLLDEKNGSPLAIMDGGYLTAMRTGGISGLATKLLSRKDASVHTLFGTGGMARAHAWAIDSVRDIKKIIIHSVDPAEIQNEFVKSLEGIVKSEIVLSEDPEEAAGQADIITLITTSKTPVINGEWIKPGTHINGAGSHEPSTREIDTNTITRSKVVCDLIEACKHEAGDLIIPAEEKKWSLQNIHASLAEIVTHNKPARENSREITVFKTVGLALQDISVATHVYNKAVEMNIGVDYNF